MSAGSVPAGTANLPAGYPARDISFKGSSIFNPVPSQLPPWPDIIAISGALKTDTLTLKSIMRKFFNRKKLSQDPGSGSATGTSSSVHHTKPTDYHSTLAGSAIDQDPSALGSDSANHSQHRDSSTASLISAPSTHEHDTTYPTDNPLASPNTRDNRDKRQVAFVSPDITSLVTTRPPTPPTPQPSHPSLRSSSAAGNAHGSTRTVMNYANTSSFHHPPASVMSPHRPAAGSTGWRSDGSAGSQSGSQLGHSASLPSPDLSRDTYGDRMTPTPNNGYRPMTPLSTVSSGYQVRRSSGGVIGPADTWGGNVIGGRLGEDIYQPMTWSEMTDLDLVENLSGRERTRQEVLWEIVASEERYVSELVSLRNNYITPILYPMIAPILLTPPATNTQSNFFKSYSSVSSSSPTTLTPPTTASDFLPIAAQFVRSSSRCSRNTSNHSQDHLPDMESEDSHSFPVQSAAPITSPDPTRTLSPSEKNGPNHNRLSFNTRFGIRSKRASQPDLDPNVQALSNYNQSSSSVPHMNFKGASTLRGIRHYLRPPNPPNKLHKAHQDTIQQALTNHANFEYLLPESLRIIFNIVNDGMFRGHEDLSVQLKEKYLEQFPLVRDLTSVWAEQTWIIEAYAVYVQHLERALRDIEETLAVVGRKNSTAPKEMKRLASIIMLLEENAAVQGECGLAICLSKPFQRLLKYPLLFQNLLYHTDASTHEYESAQAMAISIDGIVRSIEDGKISEEERTKARDVWSRIDGVNEKAIMVPQSDRLLMSEESVWQPVPGKEKRTLSDAAEGSRAVSPISSRNVLSPSGKKEKSTIDRLRILKGQKSFRRLSDMVGTESKQPTLGSKRDIWLVVFSDVVLRCQRVGVTRMSTSYPSWLKDKQKGKRLLPGQERNLYKFLKIERWEKHPSIILKEANQAHAEDMANSTASSTAQQTSNISAQSASSANGPQPERVSLTTNGTDEYERIRRESAMSFSYDQDDPKPIIAPIAPLTKGTLNNKNVTKITSNAGTASKKFTSNPAPASRIVSPTTQSVIGKRTAAVTKFSNRVPAGHQFQGVSGSMSPCGSSSAHHHRSSAGVHTGATTNATTSPVALQYRYETPTTSTLAKKAQASAARALSPAISSRAPPTRRRAGSTSGSANNPPKTLGSTPRTRAGSIEALRPATQLHQSAATAKRNTPTNRPVQHPERAPPSAVVSKKPSEDFSAFKSYFDTPSNTMSSLAIAFPT
ncbi:hypothetical protein, variant [Puccinia triticina 1-1 BBBD Race 1]|uniref:DH domain-containing protein n=2 Tax=Puccinia triticina TaxID=208348 RepID=A0A180G454_PUCT1|nr:uncharacterized protein PtA15_3A704 [Puccinia triticina]OAV87424.1 hypothetical protein, variant [Puccinia triticina 1-1 BBBD Race 1]WAQ83335.1 hypothetical protein PtA15_3A704 [Puccinia triticina]